MSLKELVLRSRPWGVKSFRRRSKTQGSNAPTLPSCRSFDASQLKRPRWYSLETVRRLYFGRFNNSGPRPLSQWDRTQQKASATKGCQGSSHVNVAEDLPRLP